MAALFRLATHLVFPSPSPCSCNARSFFLRCSLRQNIKHFSCTPAKSTRLSRKAKQQLPETILRHQLGLCSKHNDLAGALNLYNSAVESLTPLSLPHFNCLLYLCSSHSAFDSGFKILSHMRELGISPNESTFTSAARLAAVADDPNLSFDLVLQMAESGIPPKLRSFAPAILGFCKRNDFDGARRVELKMDEFGVAPDEPELVEMFRVNAEAGRGDEVYRILHRMRALVRQVQETTAEKIESWFGSEAAAGVGVEQWDGGEVKEGIAKGGGGWHGQGWLGKGTWSVGRSEINVEGVCQRCGEKLVCVDIDQKETEEFATSVAALALEKETMTDFVGFQEWLERHGPFDAVVDGANVGLSYERNFNFLQLNGIVNGMRQMSPSKRMPLVILHHRRVKAGAAANPRNKKLLENWRKSGVLYATPPGSNDDWYWLYAAVSSKSLLVTNDEMRDHLFELLGSGFFPRWKEKHQVRFTISKEGPTFHMPPRYSIVIQESETGSWHLPTVIGDDIEAPRQWVCATRNTPLASYSQEQFVGMACNM